MTKLTIVKVDIDNDVLETARQLLAAVERGEVAAFGYAAVLTQNEGIQTAIAKPDGVGSFLFLGALERLKLRFHNRYIDD